MPICYLFLLLYRALRTGNRVAAAAAISVACVIVAIGASPDGNPPNILLITCDNLGYGDLAMFNSESNIKSPSLDRLASQGVRLTSFYTGSPTCTVSRACLLTGRVPELHGLKEQLAGVEGNYGVGLNPKETLIPQYLKSSSTPYVTGCFGKWNIGFAEGSRPTERGFDEFIGHASGNMDYYAHNYRERHDLYRGTTELHREGEYATDIFASAAISFIQRHHDRPWFCYLPFNAPHFPVLGNKEDGIPCVWQTPDWALEAIGLTATEEDPRNRYEAVVHALDNAIGRVIEAVRETDAVDNTFVFFMSDNGAFRLNRAGVDVGNNDPLRGGGVTCWEGGLRVPAIARWPGKIDPGTVIDEPLWSLDLLVACTELAGVSMPGEVAFNGKNPLPCLTKSAPSPHKSLFFSFRQSVALRKGDWKIIRRNGESDLQLFNLRQDIGEKNDLAKLQTERVSELSADLANWLNSFE